jgi:O-antigen/teichoic acid export membrane protein
MNMTVSIGSLVKGTIWTIGAYGASQVIRLVTNIALARLLAPDLFGLMLIVYSLRTGFALISDIGIGQNIIYNKNAENPDFYNTAWSLEIIRNAVLWLLCVAAAAPVARFYESPILAVVIPISALSLIIAGASSASRYLVQKRLHLARLNTFETITAFISSAAGVLFAYISPTIWALVFGGLFTTAVTTIGSYFLLHDVKQRFHISGRFVAEILHFGKWIFLSSIVYFLSTNFDRLFLAKEVPLELLGVYGISRSISELIGLLFMRLGNVVLFPFIASHSHMERGVLRKELVSIRAKFLLVAALGFSFFAATADLAIEIIYDDRYRAAAWMLPILVIGSWFTILANINESTLLGLGKPSYQAISNGAKFAYLLVGLPLSLHLGGAVGCIAVIALGDLCRYVPVLAGQRRERFSFGVQDFLLTLAVVLLIGLWEWLRWVAGFGTSLDSFPV